MSETYSGASFCADEQLLPSARKAGARIWCRSHGTDFWAFRGLMIVFFCFSLVHCCIRCSNIKVNFFVEYFEKTSLIYACRAHFARFDGQCGWRQWRWWGRSQPWPSRSTASTACSSEADWSVVILARLCAFNYYIAAVQWHILGYLIVPSFCFLPVCGLDYMLKVCERDILQTTCGNFIKFIT